MPHTRTLSPVLVLTVLVALLSAGCTASQRSRDGSTEVKTNRITGTARITLARSTEAMHQVALETAAWFKFTVSKNSADGLMGIVKAQTAEGKTV